MTTSMVEQGVVERREFIFTPGCSLVAAVVDEADKIVLFSNGTQSIARARSVLKRLLEDLGPELEIEGVAISA